LPLPGGIDAGPNLVNSIRVLAVRQEERLMSVVVDIAVD